MTATNYRQSAEWRNAERAMALTLGHRILDQGGETLSRYMLQFVEPDAKGELKVVAQRPTDTFAYDGWVEAVRLRIDHDKACGLAWRIYSAAMGIVIKDFNGMPEGEPEEAVKRKRQELESEIRKLGDFIVREVSVGALSRSESTVDTAIRVMRQMSASLNGEAQA